MRTKYRPPKKICCLLLVTIMMFVSCCPVISFASDGQEAKTNSFPIEIICESSLRKNFSIAATGLINHTKLDMAKAASNKITVYATTGCISEVSKCGFTEIIVQRRLSTSQPWSNYITYNDLYANNSYYDNTFNVMVTTGYQYRLTGVHYAYRNIFSTQKMDNYSTYMQF